MIASAVETRLTSILSWGSLLVTLIVTDRLSTDPANLGKMLTLSLVAFSLLPILILNYRELIRKSKSAPLLVIALLIVMGISIILSSNTLERGVYGAFGRNTGLLTYFCLGIVFLSALLISRENSFRKIVISFYIAGVFNVAYCLLAEAGFDIFTWLNPYKSVLGTFGNPNFIGAFMGIFVTLLSVRLFDVNQKITSRAMNAVLLLLSLLVVYLSDALQGLLLAAFGISFSLFYRLRSSLKTFRISQVFFGSITLIAVVAVLGIFRQGPLSNLLYKPSVTFRWEYWKAAFQMGKNNMLSGVGLDSYGVYYRTFRSKSATEFPGLNTTTDAAHNVFLDVFSGSGFFAFIIYFSISIYILILSIRHLHNSRSYDVVFLTLFLCWCAYQLQSIISINQIGLAIWGWLFGGALIAYIKCKSSGVIAQTSSREKALTKSFKKGTSNGEVIDASLALSTLVFAIVGFLVALPPFLNDMEMRKIKSGKASVSEVVSLGEKWPTDTLRLNRLIILLAQNGMNSEAKRLAAFGTEKFPNDFASWSALYDLTLDGTSEQDAYRIRINRIEPYDPKYFKK
jgi:hypothetical protein